MWAGVVGHQRGRFPVQGAAPCAGGTRSPAYEREPVGQSPARPGLSNSSGSSARRYPLVRARPPPPFPKQAPASSLCCPSILSSRAGRPSYLRPALLIRDARVSRSSFRLSIQLSFYVPLSSCPAFSRRPRSDNALPQRAAHPLNDVFRRGSGDVRHLHSSTDTPQESRSASGREQTVRQARGRSQVLGYTLGTVESDLPP